MLLFPGTGFAQLPAVDDISIKNKLIAFVMFQKVNDFFCFAG
jgi:hypothetical protein